VLTRNPHHHTATCRDQLDASYDKLKALRQQEAALLAELSAQQASTSSSADELAGLQAQVDEAAHKMVRTSNPCAGSHMTKSCSVLSVLVVDQEHYTLGIGQALQLWQRCLHAPPHSPFGWHV
jgi:ABC-type transport system involved in cytochrome bd biosynthesis fused ATPase/permease subunit